MAASLSRAEVGLESGKVQSSLRTGLARGSLSREQEIQLRARLLETLLQTFQETRRPTDLYDAVHHAECIVEHLTEPSEQRARHLDELCYMKMRAFDVSKSIKALDEAVEYGKRARADAEHADALTLCEIYHNLGSAVSQRAQVARKEGDLNDAVECARQVLCHAQEDSLLHQITRTNLATRLLFRYRREHVAADLDEAMKIVERQLESFPPSSTQHGAALVTQSALAFERYRKTNMLEDLDMAITASENSLLSLSGSGLTGTDPLRRIAALYQRRFEETKSFDNFESRHAHARARAHASAPPARA